MIEPAGLPYSNSIFSFEKFALNRGRLRRLRRRTRHHKLAGGARLCTKADPGQLGGASLPGSAPPAALLGDHLRLGGRQSASFRQVGRLRPVRGTRLTRPTTYERGVYMQAS